MAFVAELAVQIEQHSLVIKIGGIPIRVNTTDEDFLELLQSRYVGYVVGEENPEFEFEMDLKSPEGIAPDAPVRVAYNAGRWYLERGDFRAQWSPKTRRGTIRQTANPYAIDSVLRIVHTLVLVQHGGFLLHSASAIRNGKAFLLAGVSGAGKTTISRLAPSDATLLTDEISYVRRHNDGYIAHGTPFTGELARLGQNTSAPVAALYLLAKGNENRIEPVGAAQAARELLGNMLFFADDPEMVHQAFQTACDFVGSVPVRRLTFMPDARVWELIG
jgi:hypothetical protein